MSGDLLSRALARTREAATLSRISRNDDAPKSANSLPNKGFSGFPGFPDFPEKLQDSAETDRRAAAGAQAGARARGYDVPGNSGNSGNSNAISGIPSPFFSQDERETGKSGKSRPGLLALAAQAAPHLRVDAVEVQAFFDERAGIREFDGGMSRSEAEAGAVEDVLDALRRSGSDGPLVLRAIPSPLF